MIHLTLLQHWHFSILFDSFVTLLIEEKKSGGIAGVYPAKYSARLEKCFTPRAQRNHNVHKASFNRAGRLSRITWYHYHFPEIESSDIKLLVGIDNQKYRVSILTGVL
jgi:hypothetical protein